MIAYMVQGSYGSLEQNSITSQMLNRCSNFIEQGIKCVSITLDFKENIYAFDEDNKRIPKGLIIKNPYLDFARIADEKLEKVGKFQFNLFRLAQIDFRTGEIHYYQPNGTCIDASYSYKEVENKRQNGVIIKKIIVIDNKIKRIYIYSMKGICICIQDFKITDDSLISIKIFDYSLNLVHTYYSNYAWTVDWLRDIVEVDSERDDKKVVICDGAGSARKITEIAQGIKKIYSLKDNPFNSDGSIKAKESWTFNNLSKFDAIITHNKFHLKKLVTEFPQGSFIYLRNFFGLNIIQKKNTPERNTIGYFGRINQKKSLLTIFDCVKLIKEKYNIELGLKISATHDTKKKLENEIHRFSNIAFQKGILDQITFERDNTSSLSVIRACMVSIYPVDSNASIYPALKSMQVGVPVIAYSNKNELNQVIKDNVNGFLVKPGMIDELVDKVALCLNDTKKYKKMSKNAFKDSEKYISDVSIMKSWEKIIN